MSAQDATRVLRWSRWGIAIGALATGGALVLLSWRNYAGVEQATDTLVRGQTAVFVEGILQRLRDIDPPPSEDDLKGIVTTYAEDGLRYVAVLGRGVIEAGDARGALPKGGPRQATELSRVGERVRVVARAPRGPRHGGPPMQRAMRRHMMAGPDIVLEFEPVHANKVRDRARGALVASGAAAGAIWVAAAIGFVLLRRQEAAAARRARERHLAALGEMSAVLAHELRNPLASLKGHAQLLAESLPDDEPRRAKAERVVGEAVRLEALTTGLLDFVRTGEIRRERTAPGALLRAAAGEVDGERVEVDDSGAPEAWSLDAVRMQQVLGNLLRNALQASPDGARVSAAARVSAGRLIFEVADVGEGIPAGEERRIFEPFRTGRVRGTGLGLAVAKRVVELHGGEISAHNRKGGGALLRVVIPG